MLLLFTVMLVSSFLHSAAWPRKTDELVLVTITSWFPCTQHMFILQALDREIYFIGVLKTPPVSTEIKHLWKHFCGSDFSPPPKKQLFCHLNIAQKPDTVPFYSFFKIQTVNLIPYFLLLINY